MPNQRDISIPIDKDTENISHDQSASLLTLSTTTCPTLRALYDIMQDESASKEEEEKSEQDSHDNHISQKSSSKKSKDTSKESQSISTSKHLKAGIKPDQISHSESKMQKIAKKDQYEPKTSTYRHRPNPHSSHHHAKQHPESSPSQSPSSASYGSRSVTLDQSSEVSEQKSHHHKPSQDNEQSDSSGGSFQEDQERIVEQERLAAQRMID
ncbi:hypothetical protein ADUPG1_007828, partial [Aduncisulcus paluster]